MQENSIVSSLLMHSETYTHNILLSIINVHVQHKLSINSLVPLGKTWTAAWVFIAQLNDCILDNPGQIANPIIAKVDPVHIMVYAHVYVQVGKTSNSQLIDTCN